MTQVLSLNGKELQYEYQAAMTALASVLPWLLMLLANSCHRTNAQLPRGKGIEQGGIMTKGLGMQSTYGHNRHAQVSHSHMVES